MRQFVVALVLAVTAAGCNKVVPIHVLEPVDVTTGWHDSGILQDGKNKIVPSVQLKLRNKSDQAIDGVQINAIFRRVGEQEMWGEHYGWAVRKDALAPGATTGVMVMRSALGYTGDQPRMQIMQHKDFIDAKVEIYLKKGSQTWAKLGDFPIERQLITQ
ncbi:MAG: hypothetical protein IT181_28385 [Acidobacteria bacterium]|nr:hypothetical protein [Acidobacteriota bacterium]